MVIRKLTDWIDNAFGQASQDDMTSEESLRRAAVVLLVEVMHVDHEVDEQERAVILNCIQDSFALSEQEARAWLTEFETLAKDVVSLHEFTSLLNRHYDYTQKLDLLGWCWRVVFADGVMDRHEEHLVRRLAELLHIRHSDYIRLRQQHR